ncbi:MAG: hypothetical protein L0H24_06310, partial [Microlunatus sp.]|nr:hypothetical protein [Microlunatus sp.]
MVHDNMLRHIPDEQTYYLGGYVARPVYNASSQQVADLKTGDPLPDYPWVIGSAEFWSPEGGHHVVAHASLNLKTGKLTGTITVTNYVRATGFKSGTLFIPVNAAGDP